MSFDGDWRFFHGEVPGAEAVDFDDSGGQVPDLPHHWSTEGLPGGSGDGAATADPRPPEDNQAVVATAPPRIGPFDRLGSLETAGPFPLTSTPSGKQRGWTVNGEGRYRKRFAADGLGGADRVEVCFDGVYCNSEVWLNGMHLGFHSNGYTLFHHGPTPHLQRSEENVLVVRARNVGSNSRWYARSETYRHT